MRVQVFLKTPLYRGRYGAQRDLKLDAHVVELVGDAEAHKGGLDLRQPLLFDEKGREVDAPFDHLFLPMSKVDYYVVLDAA